jgi:hypothetical protein
VEKEMPRNWEQRDKKRMKKRYGMKVSGRSAFLIEEAQQKRDQKFIEKTRDKQRKGK